jgi:hypothetical protein
LPVLTTGFGDRGNGGVRPAVKRRRRRWWCSASVTGDTEKSEGGEQQVWCKEAEAGVHFIWSGTRWRGGEEAGGGGVLIPVGFEGVKGGRGDGMTLIQWGK